MKRTGIVLLSRAGAFIRTRPKRFLVPALVVAFLLCDRLFPPQLTGHGFAQVVTDRHGRPLRAFATEQGVWRYPVSLQSVSPYYIEALLGYEDRWFYYHPGVNPLAILRAAYQNITAGRVISGGSTLTMQTARLLHPHERSIRGKLYQAFRALQLELRLSKKEILNLYLNLAPFGGPIEGIEAASHTYLQKAVIDLTRAEAALLAVLPQAPSRLRPDQYPSRAQRARDKVLDRLVDLGIWNRETVDEAKLEVVSATTLRSPMQAPLLSRRLAGQHDAQVIRSTLDAGMQFMAADLLAHYADRLPEKTSAAVLIADNPSGAVRAYVGTAGFADAGRFGHVDMVRAVRSPGSTLKPFLYGLAMDDGLIHSGSLLVDVPRTGKQYRPKNFHRGFSGPVSVSHALQRSLNVPAVNLVEHFGPHRFRDRLQQVGLPLHLPAGAQSNPAMILGGAGTTLESLVTAYRGFATGGRVSPLKMVLQADEATPTKGRAKHQPRHLMSAGAAWIIADILADTPRPDHGRLPLSATSRPFAWKTGTSYGYRDAWAFGVSPKYTIGVWVGRPDGTPSPGHYGAVTAAPVLFQLMDGLQTHGGNGFARPESVTRKVICWPLGLEKHRQKPEHCHREKDAWSLDGQAPPTLTHDLTSRQANPLTFWVNRDGGGLVDSRCRARNRERREAALWPSAVEPWIPYQWRRNRLIPRADASCTVSPAAAASNIRITGLIDGSLIKTPLGEALPSVNLKVTGAIGQVIWYVNGELKHRSRPNQILVHQMDQTGENSILAIDSQGGRDTVNLVVMVD